MTSFRRGRTSRQSARHCGRAAGAVGVTASLSSALVRESRPARSSPSHDPLGRPRCVGPRLRATPFVSGPTAAALASRRRRSGCEPPSTSPCRTVATCSGPTTTSTRRRSCRAIDRAHASTGLAVMSATRTLIDLARFVGPVADAALDAALRDGLTAEHALHRRIVALRSSGRVRHPQAARRASRAGRSRGAATAGSSGGTSELCARTRLPRPIDPGGAVTEPAIAWSASTAGSPEPPVVVELLGYRWHRTKDQMAPRRCTAERPRSSTDCDRCSSPYDQVTADPSTVVDQTRAALRA